MDLKLKEIRKKKGITQSRLAELLGVAEVTIQQYENGKRIPSLDKIEKLSLALDVSEAQLLGLHDSYTNTIYDFLSPGEEIYYNKLKTIYELIPQIQNGVFCNESKIEKKLISLGTKIPMEILNTEELDVILKSLTISLLLKRYLKDPKDRDKSSYTTLISAIKSSKLFDTNNIEEKL